MNSPLFKTRHSFPHAILHIDGDAFFASCEQARNPALKGKPVITGQERGIAASMSYEAKAMGVTRAMSLWEIKKICPNAVILPSDYETYSILSQRFYTIVRRYTSEVEEYGIDECFADITGYDKPFKGNYTRIAEHLQETLRKELGFTFSIGLGPNKVLAKMGSKWKKPYGLTVVQDESIPTYLKDLPVGKIWGIGPQTNELLSKYHISTALEFADAREEWVRNRLHRPFYDIWQELNGAFVLPLVLAEKTTYASIQKFKTFTPPSSNPDYIFAQLSKNIENACIKLRRYNLAMPSAMIILRTQTFHHQTVELSFPSPSNLPPEIIPLAREAFFSIFKRGELYRATGFVTYNLTPPTHQADLFTHYQRKTKLEHVYASMDKVSAKYGKHSVYLGTSWQAHRSAPHISNRRDEPERKTDLFLGETKRKRLNIPMMMSEGI